MTSVSSVVMTADIAYELAAWVTCACASTIPTASGYSSCSCSRIRADRVSAVSSSRIGTTRCAMIGPPSRVSSTKWTVQPANLTPCSSACLCASRPVNEGSRLGWMFRILPRYAAMKSRERILMYPARQTRSICRSRKASTISLSCSSRERPRRSIKSVSIPHSFACCSPAADGWSLMTNATSACGILPDWAAPINAAILDPRPEIRIARRNILARKDICSLFTVAEYLGEVVFHVTDIILHQILERDGLSFRNGFERDLLQSVLRARRVQFGPISVGHQMVQMKIVRAPQLN